MATLVGSSILPNFPLDVYRYHQMTEALRIDDYPTVDEIAEGNGRYLHWRGGYDGRDIESVMGGLGFSDVVMYVIDFNQVHSVLELADLQVLNSRLRCILGRKRRKMSINSSMPSSSMIPITPRPRPQDSLYQAFCTGYMRAYANDSNEARQLGEAFLRSIEAEQAKRDSASGRYFV